MDVEVVAVHGVCGRVCVVVCKHNELNLCDRLVVVVMHGKRMRIHENKYVVVIAECRGGLASCGKLVLFNI